MSPENRSRIVASNPDLYLDCDGPWCGDGWTDLLVRLSVKLREWPDLRALQVKEKFGGLRFYTAAIDVADFDQVLRAITEAEQEAARTCDVCGEPGKLSGKYWVFTRCENHKDWRGEP